MRLQDSLCYHQFQKTTITAFVTLTVSQIMFYLEAEQSYSVDDVVLSVGSRGWQYWGEVIDPQREEEQETQKVAPNVHSLIGQNENTATE